MRYSDIAVKVDMDEFAMLPNAGLKAYLNRNVTGYDCEVRTPFSKGESVTEVLNEWLNICEPMLKSEETFASLLDFELAKAKQVGPLSIQRPLRDRLDDIVHYYECVMDGDEYEPIDGSVIRSYIQDVRRAVGGMHAMGMDEAIRRMKKSTSGGLPEFAKRRTLVPYVANARLERHEIYWRGHWYKVSAILGWRGQEGGPKPGDVKQRVVFMFPMLVNLYESQVYNVLIEAYQKAGLVPAWISNDAVDLTITKLFDSKEESDPVIVTDFTKFDQHFNVQCQNAVRSVLQSTFTEINDWLDAVYPIKFEIPLMTRWGEVTMGAHGMGSGSGGTNADETILHTLLQRESAKMAGKQLNPFSMCLGDDGILSYPGCSVEHVTHCYTRHGLDMNETKQSSSTDSCVYLQRWHSQHYRVNGRCVGVYSTCRALGRLCEQERYYDPQLWSREMVAIRQLSILENIKWHPLREQFADFCITRDIYRLGIDIPGFLDNLSALVSKANDQVQDFISYSSSVGEGVTNPDGWWIVSYLKSKA
nr:RNA-dependent RNA polymerase [Marmot picobirnavirus]